MTQRSLANKPFRAVYETEDGGIMFLRKPGTRLPDYAVL
jgi:hypothetical protein